MNASCSMFSQILKLIPRIEFERIVKETKAEYRSKGLSSWSQFVGMLFCQLGPCPLAAGDRRRAEELRGQARPPGHRGPGPFLAVLRQRAPALAVVREGLLRTVRDGRRQGAGANASSASRTSWSVSTRP